MSRKSAPDSEPLQEVIGRLPPDLGLLLAAMRAEFQATISSSESRLLNKLLLMGIPLGAVGGFVAQMVKPEIGSAAVTYAAGFVPFL